ncbi:hypothetical protein I4F81_006131 [Pyropia yezoensis]|uniref:Uncharacterized protein n=1 Tax=Pyropia yezoensis TaxID=2788 RepID=A0ACC3C1A9_PYRYE|nr:hypothetical protein I4F81_006131 [Neopyropia yezoensis]
MVYIRSVAVWIRDMRTPPEVIAAAESERLASVEAGAATVRERWAQPPLPSGFWANNPGLHQAHTTAVAGAAAGRGSADYARLIEALKTDALGEEGGPGGK